MKNRLLLFLLSAVILGALFYSVDVGKAVELISRADLGLVVACVSLLSLNLTIKLLRWHFFLEAYKIKLGVKDTASTYLASLFIANLTPARVGEVSRPLFLKKRGLSTASRILPSVVVERILDTAVLLVFAVVFIFLFSSVFPTYVYAGLSIVGLAIVGLLVILYSERLAVKFVNSTARLPFVRRTSLQKKADRIIREFYKGLAELRTARLFVITLLTVAMWVSEFTITYLSALALGVSLPFLLVAGIFSVGVLLGIASSLPGGLGPTEAIFTGFFVLAGVPAAQALSITLLARLLTYGMTLLQSAPFVIIEARCKCPTCGDVHWMPLFTHCKTTGRGGKK